MLIVFHGIFVGLASAAEIISWEELAAQWLNAIYHQPGGRWVATVIAAPPGWNTLKPGTQARILKIAQGVEKPKKIMHLLVQRNEKEQGVITVQTQSFKKVMVANRVLARGEKIAGEDWRWEEKNQEIIPGDAFISEQELSKKRLRKYMSPNEIITAHALEAIPEMARGKQITVRVVGNGVCIQADAETLEEGYFGKKIKVKLIGNGKIITASVAGYETADVMLVSRW